MVAYTTAQIMEKTVKIGRMVEAVGARIEDIWDRSFGLRYRRVEIRSQGGWRSSNLP